MRSLKYHILPQCFLWHILSIVLLTSSMCVLCKRLLLLLYLPTIYISTQPLRFFASLRIISSWLLVSLVTCPRKNLPYCRCLLLSIIYSPVFRTAFTSTDGLLWVSLLPWSLLSCTFQFGVSHASACLLPRIIQIYPPSPPELILVTVGTPWVFYLLLYMFVDGIGVSIFPRS